MENIKQVNVGGVNYAVRQDLEDRIETLEKQEAGGSGTTDYSELSNKPSIGGVTLEGNKTLDNLGIASKQSVAEKQDTINKVNVSVGSGTGTPSGSASVSGSTLNISLENVKGEKGNTGETGPANNITIGTVTASDSTDEASATMTGKSPNQVLNLVLPRGRQGNSGVTGDTSDIVVVNDLNGGESETGSIKVLAAEQGKVLGDKIKENEREINNIPKSDFFISYIVNLTTEKSAIQIVDGAIKVLYSVSDAKLYKYNLDKNADYFLKTSWLSMDEGFPLIIFTGSDGSSLVDYMYPNSANVTNVLNYTKIEIPEGAEVAYVNSRYMTYGECGLFKKVINLKDVFLKYPYNENAINIYDNSNVKDGICLTTDSHGCYISDVDGYSSFFTKIDEESQYVLSNYNCPSKVIAIFDSSFKIVDYKSTDDTISTRISKDGDWLSDSSPITINTSKGDAYLALNVQRKNDNYYSVINTKIMLTKLENHVDEYVSNIENSFAKKLFSYGIRYMIPLNLEYGSYWDKNGNSQNNDLSCKCELDVNPGTPLLIHALPANARYIHECDAEGVIIKSYNDPTTSSDDSITQDIVIVTSAKTKKIKISTSIIGSIQDIKVYSLTPSYSTESKKEISILFIGNSLTQDAVSYVPFLLRKMAPFISFKFYIWYNGGKNLEEQYNEYFLVDKPCEIFSISENSYSWSNKNSSVTIKEILAQYKFDILCLQEYFNYKESYTEADIEVYKNVIKFIEDNYNEPFKLVTLLHQPKRNDAERIYNLTLQGVKKILSETPTEDVLVPGVAIYKALSTSLNSLGDVGGLSPDGTHAQEGLPCLMQAYTIVMWIFRQLGVAQSILNNKSYINSENYTQINVPGANLGSGVISGTEAENRLAQEIAISSYKESIKIKLVE